MTISEVCHEGLRSRDCIPHTLRTLERLLWGNVSISLPYVDPHLVPSHALGSRVDMPSEQPKGWRQPLSRRTWEKSQVVTNAALQDAGRWRSEQQRQEVIYGWSLLPSESQQGKGCCCPATEVPAPGLDSSLLTLPLPRWPIWSPTTIRQRLELTCIKLPAIQPGPESNSLRWRTQSPLHSCSLSY